MNDFWIILVGALVASSCSVLGCFLIVRKMTLIGDAISHSVLPGIVLAFLITGTRDRFQCLIRAAVSRFTYSILNPAVPIVGRSI
jgi:manganese/zinc/iron transport system permease protein